VPVVVPNVTSVTIAKPPGVWYEFWTGATIKDGEVKQVTLFDVPVFLRGGRIVPLYCTPGDGTVSTIRTPLSLMIAGDEHGEAEGYFYMDDGLTFKFQEGEFVHRKFALKGGVLSSTKLDPLEGTPPEFLSDAVINNLTFYLLKPDGSVKVTNVRVDLSLVDEWTYNVGFSNDIGMNGNGVGTSGIVVYGVVAVCLLGAVCIVFGIVMMKRRQRDYEVSAQPMKGEDSFEYTPHLEEHRPL
jgi:hypothetical protein